MRAYILQERIPPVHRERIKKEAPEYFAVHVIWHNTRFSQVHLSPKKLIKMAKRMNRLWPRPPLSKQQNYDGMVFQQYRVKKVYVTKDGVYRRSQSGTQKVYDTHNLK